MSVNIAAAIQSQMLQSLLQALQSADQPLKAGTAIEAKFVGWSEASAAATVPGKPALAEALIQIAGRPTAMLIEATPERRAQMQAGATLTLQVEAAASEGQPARMRLLTIQSPTNSVAGRGAQMSAEADSAEVALAPRPGAAVETVRAAAGPLIGAALGRQNGLGALFADLEVLTRAPTPLPASVLSAASRALDMRTDAARLGDQPDVLKAAVAASGLLHEASLAEGAPADAAANLKGALIALRQALRDALGSAAETPKAWPPQPDGKPEARMSRAAVDLSVAARPAAPTRDGLPAPQGVSQPSIDAVKDSAATMLAKVLERTEGALDRINLSQFASLPAHSDAQLGVPTHRWFAELPLALDGRTAVLPLEIEEDHAGGAGSGPQAKLWRIRFALDVEPMGPLHAMVTLQGRDIGVIVWAERDATSKLVRDHAPDLKAALLDGDFNNPQIEVLAGQPMRRAAHAGHYLDRRS